MRILFLQAATSFKLQLMSFYMDPVKRYFVFKNNCYYFLHRTKIITFLLFSNIFGMQPNAIVNFAENSNKYLLKSSKS